VDKAVVRRWMTGFDTGFEGKRREKSDKSWEPERKGGSSL
jgi:hypothetical protein